MRSMAKIILTMMILGGLVFSLASDGDKKGLVTYADGQVKRRPVETESWTNAPVNTDVLSGDMVRTYRRSCAEIDLAQLDIIRLAPRTAIHIEKLYEETKDKKVSTKIKLEEGELWASVHEIEMNTEFDVSAPIAAAAITGTTLRMVVADDSTTQLKVYNGEVSITNAPEKKDLKPISIVPHQIKGPTQIPGPHEVSLEEWVYIVKSMQQITIDRQGKVMSTGEFSSEDKDEQNSFVKWNLKRDLQRRGKIK